MKRCVVYMRVSTPSQTLGSSFARQLECCTAFASKNGFYIAAIFSDACSGDGPTPSRSLAYVTATTLRCPILAESQDRWSRGQSGCDELSHACVVFAADGHYEYMERLTSVVANAVSGISQAEVS